MKAEELAEKNSAALELGVSVIDLEHAAERIVQQLIQTEVIFKNATIEFAKVMIQVMDEFPEAQQIEIWKKVREDERIQDIAISLSRAWDATKMLRARRDLLDWTSDQLRSLPSITEVQTPEEVTVVQVDIGDGETETRTRPHIKKNGEINWEFYMRLYRYDLTETQRVQLERLAKVNGWTVRELNDQIKLRKDAKAANESFQDLKAYRQRKGDLIKVLMAIARDSTVEQLENYMKMLNQAKMVAEENLSSNIDRIVEVISRV